jgi:hypothetical protein
MGWILPCLQPGAANSRGLASEAVALRRAGVTFGGALATDAAGYFRAVLQPLEGNRLAAFDAKAVALAGQMLQGLVHLAQGIKRHVAARQVDFAVGVMGAFAIGILQQLLACMLDAILPAQMGLQLALQLALALQQGGFKLGMLGGAQVLAHGFLLT